jgi:hypothetical protein
MATFSCVAQKAASTAQCGQMKSLLSAKQS